MYPEVCRTFSSGARPRPASLSQSFPSSVRIRSLRNRRHAPCHDGLYPTDRNQSRDQYSNLLRSGRDYKLEVVVSVGTRVPEIVALPRTVSPS